MLSNTNSITVIGNRLPAYVMGRPRSANYDAFAAKTTVREINPISRTVAQAALAE